MLQFLLIKRRNMHNFVRNCIFKNHYFFKFIFVVMYLYFELIYEKIINIFFNFKNAKN